MRPCSATTAASCTGGVTEMPGLYFLGLPWQHTRGSALLGWVEEDAEYVAERAAAARAPAGALPATASRP